MINNSVFDSQKTLQNYKTFRNNQNNSTKYLDLEAPAPSGDGYNAGGRPNGLIIIKKLTRKLIKIYQNEKDPRSGPRES